jgi:hypothetical protein
MTRASLHSTAALAVAAAILAFTASCKKSDDDGAVTAEAVAAVNCPEGFGWAEGLGAFLQPAAKMDVNVSATADDCLFNQWSWETFVWATAPIDGSLRFLSWKTPDELIATSGEAPRKPGMLRLDGHMKPLHMPGVSGSDSEVGAIVEADGSMLIGPNGYPVYASVHMTDGFFDTVKRNLIATGAYQNNPNQDDYFSVGDAVVKATWYRLDDGETAPAGAYTTQAEVPIVTQQCDASGACKVVTTGKFEVATVALVGMHVVGNTNNHPEFLWATFEHNMNSPAFADNSFVFDASKSDPKTYTFYKGGTPFGQSTLLVNTNPSSGPVVSFDAATGKFSPATQVVQMNRTGGDTQTNGPANIAKLNQVSQAQLKSINKSTPFQNYNLIGTVWFKPNTYVTSTSGWQNLNQTNAVGAISLMNSTAETFLQSSKGNQGNNCFECHSATSFSYNGIQPKALATRRVAIMHMIATGSAYDVPNSLPVTGQGAAAPKAK